MTPNGAPAAARRSTIPAAWPHGSGEVERRIRAYDWGATPLGPVAAWPDALKTAVAAALSSGDAAPCDGASSPPLTADAVNAFLVRFSDAVLPLSDPHEIAQRACRLVAETLGVERAYWAEVDWTTREYVVGAAVHRPGVPVVDGRFPVDAWEPFTSYHLSGRSVVVDDTQADARIPPAMRVAYARIAVGADLATPVVVDGQLRCTLAVNQQPPRHWTEEEVALVRGIAGRCWAAVDRARAGASLRESEARYRALATASTDVVYRMGPDWTEMRVLEGRGFIPDTPEPSEAWLDRYIAPEDQPRVTAAIEEAVRTHAPFDLEHRVRRADGSLGWTHSRAIPIVDEQGAITEWVGSATDVTARKQAEQAREREGRRALLIAIAGDLHRLADEGAFIRTVAARLVDHLGLDGYQYVDIDEDRAEATVRHAWHVEDVPYVLGTYPISGFVTQDGLERLRSGEPIVVDDVAGLPGDDPALAGLKAGAAAQKIGAYVAVPSSRDGRWQAYFAVADRAPRRWTPAEVELIQEVAWRVMPRVERARAERRAEGILERMGDAHGVLDRSFRIVGVNAAAERLLGRPRETLLGRSHWDVFPASVDAPVGQAFRRVVAEGIEQHLTHHYTGEGYDLHIELDAYPTDEGGVAMFWRDVTERVRAEAALAASEEKYRALFTGMDEAYAVVEVLADAAGRWTDFRFLEVNPAFMRHTGMPYPVGRTATELLGTPNPRWAELYGRAVETGEAVRVEEGELTLGRVFDLNIFRLGGDGSRRVAVLFADVTERRRAQEALRESEAQYRTLFTSIDEGYARYEVLFDDTGEPVDARIHEVNPAYERLTRRHHPVGKLLSEVSAGLDPAWGAAMATVVRTAQPVRFEGRNAEIDRWFDVFIGPMDGPGDPTIVLVLTDITERRRASDALRTSEERYRRIVEQATDYAIFSTDAGRRIESWSPGAETVFGWTADEAIGQPMDMTYTPEDRAAGVPEQEFVAARETGRAPNVRWHRRRDATLVYIEGESYARRGDDGAFLGVFKVGQDVTARLLMEEAQREEEAARREEEATLREELEVRVREATAELRALSRRLLLVQEEERRKLALELHDEVGQVLTGLGFQLAAAGTSEAALWEAQTTVSALTEQVRRLSLDLRPQVLDRYGLLAAVEWFVARYQQQTGITVHVRHQGMDQRFAAEVEIAAFRVVQEALTNVARHSGADFASVQLSHDGSLTLAIRDAGRGFDPARAADTSGLGGMRERMALLGGTLAIEAMPGGGTAIIADMPLNGVPDDAGEAAS